MSKNINKQNAIENNEITTSEVVTLNARQIKARFRKNHIASIIGKALNPGTEIASEIAENITLVSVNHFDNFTWGDKPAPHTEVTAKILAGTVPVTRSFRLYQAGPRANRLVTASKKDREISVESIDSFILDMVKDNVFEPVSVH